MKKLITALLLVALFASGLWVRDSRNKQRAAERAAIQRTVDDIARIIIEAARREGAAAAREEIAAEQKRQRDETMRALSEWRFMPIPKWTFDTNALNGLTWSIE